MADITVSILNGVANISAAGFGIPAVFGETDQYRVLKIGSGKSQLIFRSTNRDTAATVTIVVSGSSINFAAVGSDVTLTIPTTGATAKEVYDNYTANSYTSVKALVVLTIANSGSGAVAAQTVLPLATVTEFVLTDASDVANLLPYYLSTDKEYVMATALFTQDLKPEKVYIFNASSESSNSDDFSTIIATFENQDFYFLLLSNTGKIRAKEAAIWADLNEKILFVLSADTTITDDLNIYESPAIVLTETLTARDECAIVGLQAPKTPGTTTYKWKQCNGVSAQTNETLIQYARDNSANTFIAKSGLTFFVEGVMANGLFIDQKIQRDYMKARIGEAFLRLFTQNEKIPYDDTGIAQLVGTLSDQLNSFGDGGIIAAAVSTEEMKQSYNKKYQYTITAKNRAQMVVDDPAAVTAREYTLLFSFVEAGAIHTLTVTGKVVLSLT